VSESGLIHATRETSDDALRIPAAAQVTPDASMVSEKLGLLALRGRDESDALGTAGDCHDQELLEQNQPGAHIPQWMRDFLLSRKRKQELFLGHRLAPSLY
jgi:hypothetical protein